MTFHFPFVVASAFFLGTDPLPGIFDDSLAFSDTAKRKRTLPLDSRIPNRKQRFFVFRHSRHVKSFLK